MDSTNKVLALFVGLFVVILLVGVGLSRVAKNKKPLTGSLGKIFTNTKLTPTTKPARVSVSLAPTRTTVVINQTKNNESTYSNNTNNAPQTIPDTGAGTIPLIASSLGIGICLLKKSKKS